MNRFEELKNLVMELEGDFSKFYDKDNQAAGTRIRQGMQTLKNLAQQIRTEVQTIKNSKSDGGAEDAKSEDSKSGKKTAKAGAKAEK